MNNIQIKLGAQRHTGNRIEKMLIISIGQISAVKKNLNSMLIYLIPMD